MPKKKRSYKKQPFAAKGAAKKLKGRKKQLAKQLKKAMGK